MQLKNIYEDMGSFVRIKIVLVSPKVLVFLGLRWWHGVLAAHVLMMISRQPLNIWLHKSSKLRFTSAFAVLSKLAALSEMKNFVSGHRDE